MSALLLVRIDPTKLYPEFLTRLRALLDDAEQNHAANYWVVSGFRTYLEQDQLHAQGRKNKAPIVTKARGGESAHQFGIAADVCRDGIVERKGLQPDWRPETYELLRELAPKHNLVWGGTWPNPDRPHLQMPGFVTATELAPLRRKYEANGIQAVFNYLKEQPS